MFKKVLLEHSFGKNEGTFYGLDQTVLTKDVQKCNSSKESGCRSTFIHIVIAQ